MYMNDPDNDPEIVSQITDLWRKHINEKNPRREEFYKFMTEEIARIIYLREEGFSLKQILEITKKLIK
jgi:phenolic acid decarboxylase